MFDAKYIDAELDKTGSRIKRPISIYLIGGCAMSLRGLKESTKDIDIVFKDDKDCELFCDAMFGAEYHQPYAMKSEHEKLQAAKMFENKDGFHLDLFVKKVIGKLELSKGMITRADLFKSYGDLSVYLLSREDVFLFKGLASEGRKRDLPDMRVLYPNLDWKAIEEELASQRLAADLTGLFVRRLAEFRDTYKLDVPILAKLQKKGL